VPIGIEVLQGVTPEDVIQSLLLNKRLEKLLI
jgi:hypothetical protein